MKNKKTGMIVAVMAIALISLAFVVSAYRGNFEEKSPHYTKEKCDAMSEAFNNGDFEAWQEFMNDRNSKLTQVIDTQEKFELFINAREAAHAGNYELAKEIRAELGLNNGQGPKNGQGYGKMQGQGEMKQKGQGQSMNGQRLQQHK